MTCSATALLRGCMMSSSAQLRKIKKPLIERRRRERINDSLNQLKNLVLEATNKDETRYSKMEKADILEMTVAYLRATHCRRRRCHITAAGSEVDRYAAGFRECAVHVAQYLVDSGVAYGPVHDQLMTHLDKTLHAAVDVDDNYCRLPGTELESTTDAAAFWTADCDDTGRCSTDTDDDDDDSSSLSKTATDVNVIRSTVYGFPTTSTSGVPMLNCASTSPMTTTTMTYRAAVSSEGDGHSPRSADEFPSQILFTTSTSADDEYANSLPNDVVDDIDNGLVLACDVRHNVVLTSRDWKASSAITGNDIVTDSASDVWRPWR